MGLPPNPNKGPNLSLSAKIDPDLTGLGFGGKRKPFLTLRGFMSSETPLLTPLFEEHTALGAKMVDFAGWKMPVEYEGLRAEHLHVREVVGLFDVSHMGEIRLRGPKALESLEWLTSNWAGKLEPGQAQYSLLTNAAGGVVDDLIVYCMEKGADYLLCVNASNKDKDLLWIMDHHKGCEVIDESAQWGQIAVQGPKALTLLERLFSSEIRSLPSFHFAPFQFQGAEVLVARTGYTGESGVEIFVPSEYTPALWRELMSRGEDLPLKPIGLGARDTLRTEMKYPLYGNELTDLTNPYSAGLGWVIKPDKKDFMGRAQMLEAKEQGLKQKLVGFKMLDRGIARHSYSLFSFDNQEIGRVTSGTPSPCLNENIGIGYVDVAFSEVGTEFFVDIRGRRIRAQVVKTPFVTPKGA